MLCVCYVISNTYRLWLRQRKEQPVIDSQTAVLFLSHLAARHRTALLVCVCVTHRGCTFLERPAAIEGHNNLPVLDQSSHSFLIVLKSGPTRLIGWNFRGERLIDTSTSHYSLLQLFYSPKVQHSIYWQAVYIPNILNMFQTLVFIVYLACKLFIKLLTAYTQPAIGILVSHVERTTAL